MADKSTLNEVKYPEGDNIGYRLKFYTDTDGYNLDHEDGDWVSFDAALNNALDEIKSFKKYGTDIELIEIVKIITDEYITDDDEEDDYMEEEELLRSIPYDHKKYGWKVMSNLPSKSHTSYVIHQIMDWGRDYTDSDTFRSIKKIADACERYDDEYTADEYEFVIRNSGLLSKATKNSRYRWNESMKKSNKRLNEERDWNTYMYVLLDRKNHRKFISPILEELVGLAEKKLGDGKYEVHLNVIKMERDEHGNKKVVFPDVASKTIIVTNGKNITSVEDLDKGIGNTGTYKAEKPNLTFKQIYYSVYEQIPYSESSNESLDKTNKLTLNEDLFEEALNEEIEKTVYILKSDLDNRGLTKDDIDDITLSIYDEGDRYSITGEPTNIWNTLERVGLQWETIDESLNEDIPTDSKKQQELMGVIFTLNKLTGDLCNYYQEFDYNSEESEVVKNNLNSKIKYIKHCLRNIEKLDESLNEDLTLVPEEPSDETPVTPEANGVAKLILDAINDESDTIKMYNDLIANTDNEDIIKIIQDITAEENNHIGMLQRALEIVSPNASNIDDGMEEAQGMIDNEQTNAEPDFVPANESLTEARKQDKLSVGVYMDFVNADGTVTDSAKIAAFRNETWAKEFIERAKKEEDDVTKIRVELNESLSEELTREDKHDLIDYNEEVQQKISDMLFLIDKENDEARKDITKASFMISDAVGKCLGDGDIDESLTEDIEDDKIQKIKKDLEDLHYYKDDAIDDALNIVKQSKGENTLQLAKDLTSLGISYHDVKKCMLKNLKSGKVDEPLTEDLHSKFKKEIKSAYKQWAAQVEKVERQRKEATYMIPDDADEEMVQKFTNDYIPKIFPMPDDFKFEFPHNIEKNDFPFYVTYYAEYPIYEPAEGGYYYPGRDAIWSEGFETKEEAEQFLDNFVREDDEDWEKYTDGYLLHGRYIGEDQMAVVEANNEYLMRVAGYEPYQ